jgi:hypothetical protein
MLRAQVRTSTLPRGAEALAPDAAEGPPRTTIWRSPSAFGQSRPARQAAARTAAAFSITDAPVRDATGVRPAAPAPSKISPG